MTETELTIAVIIFETAMLLGIGCIVGFVMSWSQRRHDIKIAHKIVQQIKAQEIKSIETLREQLQKSSKLSATQVESAARKIVVQQQMFIAEIIEMFLKRDRKVILMLPEKLAAHTKTLFALQKGESHKPVVAAKASPTSFSANDQPKRALSKQIEELIAE